MEDSQVLIETGFLERKVSVLVSYASSMDDMRLALKRADFNTFSAETIRCSFEDSDFCDVTLVCSDGKQILAHKVILSAGSEFFQGLLKQNRHPHPLIYLHMPHQLLLPLVSFVYLGACEVDQEAIEGFLKTATILGVKGLMAQTGDVKKVNEEEQQEQHEQEQQEEQGSNSIPSAEDMFISPKSEPIHGSEEVVDEKGKFTSDETLRPGDEPSTDIKTEAEETLKGNSGKCDQCSYIGKSFWYLKRHRKAVHEGLKYSCNLCDYKVTDQTIYNTHLREVHDLNKLVCNVCDYKANRRGELQAHMRDEHQHNNLNFHCDQCDYKDTCEAFLNVHKNKEHQRSRMEETYTQETRQGADADEIQQKTIVKRQKIMDRFKKYVTKETGGKSLSDIVASEDGRQILFEFVFCYFSSYRNGDGSVPSKPTMECIRSNIKQSLLDQFGLNIMEGSKAQTRWKNLLQTWNLESRT